MSFYRWANVLWSTLRASALTSRAAVVAAMLFVPATAQAVLHLEFTDAGQTPGTAQVVEVTPLPGEEEALEFILGTLSPEDDSDVFRIRITDPATFSATIRTSKTHDQFGQIYTSDTQIFLFDENGAGIAFNDDGGSAETFPAEQYFNGILPAGHGLYSSLSPGIYLLGISAYNNDPRIDNTPTYVFPDNVTVTQVAGPNAFAVGVPFINFDVLDGPVEEVGNYEVTLTGAASVPEPGVLGLIGLLAMAAQRRRLA